MDDEQQLAHWRRLEADGLLVELDYPVFPKARWVDPWEPRLVRMLRAHEDVYRNNILGFLDCLEPLARVPAKGEGLHWCNDWLPAFDGVSIYGFLASRNPSIYLEIGSGVSTQFARRAIQDHKLRTKIVSIDPFPRKDIDALCDEVIRMRFEDTDMAIFEALPPDAMIFCDNSHRALQNSDVTVFFTEALPALQPGVLVGIHDIFLPADYPQGWTHRFYNEQYLLTCYLMGGDRLNIELPVHYCSFSPARPDLHGLLADFWARPNVAEGYHAGGAFWVSVNRTPL